MLIRVLIVLISALSLAGPAQSEGCARKKKCGEMRNCAEATYYLRTCGHSARDGNGNGIPCEKLCGKTSEAFESRLAAQGYNGGTTQIIQRLSGSFNCKTRKSCSTVLTCEEARFQLRECGNTALDKNNDGVPCNAMCKGR